MIAAWIFWCVLLGGVSVVWLLRHRELTRAQREAQALTANSYPTPIPQAPPLSVVIAAKDEADNIESCVRSMLNQDHPNFELIVVDDRSSDGTGPILDRLAGESDGKLQVVHVSELREGWFGKCNAMREGVARARGQWLCFSDADCTHHSAATLSVSMQEARQHQADFLSVLPQLETHGPWERIIQPVCGGVMMLWFSPRRVNDPDSPSAYANGAFMLMSRKTYEAFGGHEAVKAVMNEDMHMARLCKRHRLRLRVVRSEGLYSVRMYRSLRQIWKGWSRIFYGCFGTWRQLSMTLLVLLIMGLLPWVSAAAAWITLGIAAPPDAAWWWAVAGLSTAAVIIQETAVLRYYRLTGAEPVLAATYPLAAVLVVGILLNAMVKLAGGATDWRGTVYRHRAVEAAGSAGEGPDHA